MDREQQIEQLLNSICTQLDDAFDQMGIVCHYAVITAYKNYNETTTNHFMSNVQDRSLERLLLGAIKATTESKKQFIEKGKYLQ